MVAAAKLPVNIGANATAMANEIFGNGVTVVSASYTGDNRSSGIFSNGDALSPGVTPGDTGIILSTGQAQDFTNASGDSNQFTGNSTNTSGPNNVASFNAAAGTNTLDASYLDVDFIPTGDVMTMQFIFASEEYPEYALSQYQDFFGVWVNGSLVPLSVGDGDIDPGNVNAVENQNLYIDNTTDAFNTEMDGFTVSMTLTMPVTAGVVNSVRFGIADVLDTQYDSNVLIAGDSVQTALIANDDSITMPLNGTRQLDVLANDYNGTPSSSMVVTHINGQAVSAGTTVTLATGQSVTLNANGNFTLTGDGDQEDWNFAYTIDNGTDTDVGIVNVSSIPCFVAGTMILTPDGEVPVETLCPGDLVVTKDDGPQPLRWIGKRLVKAEGDFAPIHIQANTFGTHRDLLVSPLHRVLINNSHAELLFGESEVLVTARDLLNDKTVLRKEGGEVVYVHLLFDAHQVIVSEGLETESFLPGPQTTDSFEAEIVDEICAIFPELDPETGGGYSPAARRTLRKFEAELLLAANVEAA
jgi:hypothetical protein